MKAKPTNNQFLAEAQAKELSKHYGVAYVQYWAASFVATIARGLYAVKKFENGKEVAL